MTLALVIRPEAADEVIEAAIWYQQKSRTLASKFSREFESTLAKIVDNPRQYQVVESEMRRAPVAGFQHGILYVASDDEIVILSCFHGRRDPANWRERLR
jgi:plasmid stabilization system protein ParE